MTPTIMAVLVASPAHTARRPHLGVSKGAAELVKGDFFESRVSREGGEVIRSRRGGGFREK